MLRFFQTLIAADNKARKANQERLRELACRHGDEVTLFCAHDPHELEREQARAGVARRGRVTAGAPEKLWEPSAELVERARMTEYMRWLEAERGLRFDGYDELWRWSVDDLEGFWSSIWDFFDVQADGGYERVLGSREMPGAEWFAGAAAQLRRARLRRQGRRRDGDPPRLRAARARRAELGRAARAGRRASPPACARSGSSAATASSPTCRTSPRRSSPSSPPPASAPSGRAARPTSARPASIDRFAQIEPKVLFAVDGYRYGGKDFDRRDDARRAAGGDAEPASAPSSSPTSTPTPTSPRCATRSRWEELLAAGEGAELAFERVPFDHPLWVLYSSGTTGLPKAIVQGQGGILLEHLKKLNLHVDAHPGDRLFWFTTTGWMMWNFLVSGLLTRAAIVLYDGSPGHPDMSVLWDLAERAGVTMFGTSASYIAACMKAGVEPGAGRDLSRLRRGRLDRLPALPRGLRLGLRARSAPTPGSSRPAAAPTSAPPSSAASPLLPVYRGELQARALGAAVEAWDEDGNSVIDEVGELVVTEPMPSMPVFFWGDADGSRYRASYFEHYPGVWRHGDWIEITSRGTAIIYGRSDSTINRSGVRMGTSEIYRAVLGRRRDRRRAGRRRPPPRHRGLDAALRRPARGRRARRRAAPRDRPPGPRAAAPRATSPTRSSRSPRCPRTLSGKVLEVPVKRILMGTPAEQAASRDSLANPAALDYFVELAGRLDDVERRRRLRRPRRSVAAPSASSEQRRAGDHDHVERAARARASPRRSPGRAPRRRR